MHKTLGQHTAAFVDLDAEPRDLATRSHAFASALKTVHVATAATIVEFNATPSTGIIPP